MRVEEYCEVVEEECSGGVENALSKFLQLQCTINNLI